MSNIQSIPTFSFHNNSIRVQGTPDNPLFCLADVCKVLALTDPSKTVKQIKEEFELTELNSGSLDTGYGVKTATFITEPQLYFVMMRSRAKVAKEFRQWIVNEVLPAIRKTGAYVQASKQHQSYPKIFKDFCLQHNYSSEEIKMFDYLREQALKQGYAIACQKFKGQRTLGEGEIAIPKDSAKRLYLFLDNLSDKYQEIQNTVIAMDKCSSIIQHISNNMFATRESMKEILFKNL